MLDTTMRWLLVAIVASIAGCVLLLALASSNLVTAGGIVLGGTAFTLVLAAVFYAVGRSEDRDRAARESGPNDPAL